MKSQQQQIGYEFESHALNYLKRHKLSLIERNFRCKMGEIDLIMKDKNLYVFVEIRYRRYNYFGSAIESITYAKQRKIIRAATYYLQRKGLYNKVPCRFDIISSTQRMNVTKIAWIKNAFQVQ